MPFSLTAIFPSKEGGLSSVVHPSHGTLESVLWCTHQMQKYTTEETVEVVKFTFSLHKLA